MDPVHTRLPCFVTMLFDACAICCFTTCLDSMLGLSPCASSMSSIGVTRELQDLCGRQLQHLLEPSTNLHQSILATTLAGSSRPETNSVEALPYIDDYAHNLVVTFILECLADSCELGV